VKHFLVFVGLLVGTISVSAQNVQPSFTQSKINLALIAGEYSVRTMDLISTEQNLNNPCGCVYETNVPEATAHVWSLVAYSEGIATVDVLAARYVWNKGNHSKHPKMYHAISRLIMAADIANDGNAVVSNIRLMVRIGQ